MASLVFSSLLLVFFFDELTLIGKTRLIYSKIHRYLESTSMNEILELCLSSKKFPNKTYNVFYFAFQRTGPSDLYSKPPRNPLLIDRSANDDLGDFSDDEMSPLTEPIYNGRSVFYSLSSSGNDVTLLLSYVTMYSKFLIYVTLPFPRHVVVSQISIYAAWFYVHWGISDRYWSSIQYTLFSIYAQFRLEQFTMDIEDYLYVLATLKRIVLSLSTEWIWQCFSA